MDVVEKLVAATTEELPILTRNNFETKYTVNGYHVYKDIWVPEIGENVLQNENHIIQKTSMQSV